MAYEEICDYNGQTVTMHSDTGQPMTDHDCGYDCPLIKRIQSERVRELNFHKDNWAGVVEWGNSFDD